MSDPVRAQYEEFPYPARDPADERRRLIVGSPSHILEINHYLFAGRRDFDLPFRALFAGAGTGDGAIMLAQQLSDLRAPAEIVHLEPSRAARNIAEARARIRNLGNIRFEAGTIEELEGSGLGSFDYVDCCGVLHHLEDPAAGLAMLRRALAQGGGIGMMVYGALGRIGVYHAQTILRALTNEGEPQRTRLDRARRLLRQLPRTNWLLRNPFVGDHLKGGDAGLYDLLLHERDRSYTVPELAQLVASAGFDVVSLIEPARYQPESYLTDPALLERLRPLDPIQRAAVAELVAGDLKVHIAYLVPAGDARRSKAQIASDLIPILREGDGGALARGLKPGQPLKVGFGATSLSFPLPRRAVPILAQIDGRRTIGDLRRAVSEAGLSLSEGEFERDFAALYAVLNAINHLFLADRPLTLARQSASS
ncbi:MAG TPA: class I SAM-dependent methyltransferase [Alphaproteobacteria bacterium]|nr:class I SAM-dependent methyltransferase [Alphaproteobacteria bacterium]